MARETSSPPYLFEYLVSGCKGRRESLRGGCSLPVTSVVSVAVDEGYFDPVVEKVGEVFEPAVPGVVAYAPESCADGAGALCPVERDTHFFLHVLLVEEAFVERGWGWRRVESADVIVVPSAIQHVRIQHVGATERLGRFADVVDCLVGA